jgi:AraC-like DNA-binding protein
MKYEIIKPHSSIKSHVEFIEIIDSYFEEKLTLRYIRDGFFYIFYNYGDPLKVSIDENTYTCENGTFVIGMGTTPVLIDYYKNVKVFVYKMNPISVFKFLRTDLFALKDKVIQLTDLIQYKLKDIEFAMSSAEAISDKIDIFNSLLLKRIKLPIKIDDDIYDIYDKIIKTKGRLDIMNVTKTYNYSLTSIERIFKKHVGITPKIFARLKNFEDIIEIISHDPNINFSLLSNELGFYDQAHFIKEFKKMTGFSPTEFLKVPKINGNLNIVVES